MDVVKFDDMVVAFDAHGTRWHIEEFIVADDAADALQEHAGGIGACGLADFGELVVMDLDISRFESPAVACVGDNTAMAQIAEGRVTDDESGAAGCIKRGSTDTPKIATAENGVLRLPNPHGIAASIAERQAAEFDVVCAADVDEWLSESGQGDVIGRGALGWN